MAAAADAVLILAQTECIADTFIRLFNTCHFVDTPILSSTSAGDEAASSSITGLSKKYAWTSHKVHGTKLATVRSTELAINRHGAVRRLTLVLGALAAGAEAGAAEVTALTSAGKAAAGGLQPVVTSVLLMGINLNSCGPAEAPPMELADVSAWGVSADAPAAGSMPVLRAMTSDPSETWQWRRLITHVVAWDVSALHPAWREERPRCFPAEPAAAPAAGLPAWAASSLQAMQEQLPPAACDRSARESSDTCSTLGHRAAVLLGHVPPPSPSEGGPSEWAQAYAGATCVAAAMWMLQSNQGFWGVADDSDAAAPAAVLAVQRDAVKAELKAARDGLWGLDTGDGGVVEDQASEVTARGHGQEGLFHKLGGWVGLFAILSTTITMAMLAQNENFPGMLWGGAGSGV